MSWFVRGLMACVGCFCLGVYSGGQYAITAVYNAGNFVVPPTVVSVIQSSIFLALLAGMILVGTWMYVDYSVNTA